MAESVEPRDLYEIGEDGVLDVEFHPGQTAAWLAPQRFVVVTAGTQSGKTSFGPFWLEREIRLRGPGDYLVVTPTFQLLAIKLLPELLRLFEETKKYGKYFTGPRRHFTFSPAGEIEMFGGTQAIKTNIFFGCADDPESLESATVKAAWLDEACQKKFRLGSWYAVLRRLSLARGRVLLTTTPYSMGWMWTKLVLPWHQGKNRQEVALVNFDSTMNPRFPREEWERAQADLPRWLFDMLYRGIFTRPAGLIYDSFDPVLHVCARIPIPDYWQRFIGIDFGAVNTVVLFYAEEPQTGRLFLYRTYRRPKQTAATHVRAILEGEPRIPFAVGGSLGEHNWRQEYAAAGLPVQAPDIKEVEVGIQRVWGAHQRGEIIVFSDQNEYLDEKATYSRPTDAIGNVLEGIDDKSSFHCMDAERYIVGRRKRAANEMRSIPRRTAIGTDIEETRYVR